MREPHPIEPSGTFVTKGDDRWRDDRWYGRYRLWFAQVSPWPNPYGTFIRVRPGWRSLVEETLSVVATEVPRQKTWPVHLLNQKAHGRGWEFDLGPPEADYLCLEQLSDICYIDIRNLHQLIDLLAPAMEDAHFFVYSAGDGLDRWVDEVRIRDGRSSVARWTVEGEAWADFPALCAELAGNRAGDEAFVRFVTSLSDQ
ncbi:hypothetical protein [Streptomyces sp. NBC_00439]|uniref:hypothetical protein n=1 Tax=Streptomyces sp. NBC_00439 TaxID=2903650 RepID=UPI0022530113|nr:hypothetical protein [Streptomyces sp. NBC_00439]MCX5103225.1 hypothetical protein [Streptomyces sp. NBC_00439]MCX5106173.1 hypothetical protein [Streptomyces sp. NBC_00439]